MVLLPSVGALNAFGGLAATLESYALYFSPYEVAKQDAMHSVGETRYLQFQVYQTVFYLIGEPSNVEADGRDPLSCRVRSVPVNSLHAASAQGITGLGLLVAAVHLPPRCLSAAHSPWQASDRAPFSAYTRGHFVPCKPECTWE